MADDTNTPQSQQTPPTDSGQHSPFTPPQSYLDAQQAQQDAMNPPPTVNRTEPVNASFDETKAVPPAPGVKRTAPLNTGGLGAQPQVKDVHPAVQRAGLLHTIAESLAGGPRYRTMIDPDTGATTRQKVPLSNGQIGMAIALEVLSGAGAGLAGGRGNNPGGAAAAGLKEGVAIQKGRQENEEKQDEAQQQNFKNRAAVVHTNMLMRQNAYSLAEADYKQHVNNVEAHASTVADLRKMNALGDKVTASQLHQMMVNGEITPTENNAIPVGVTRVMGKDGNQAVGKYGEPMWEEEYALVDPNVSIELPKDVRERLVKYKVPGYVNGDGKAIKLPDNLSLRAHMVLDGIQQAQAYAIFDSSLQGLANGHQNVLHEDTAPKSGGAPQTPASTMRTLFTDANGLPDYGKLADAMAKHEGTKPTDRNVRNNNQGNLMATDFTKSQPGFAGTDKDGFAIFKTPQDGRNAQIALLKTHLDGQYKDASPEQYINAKYSPDSAPGNASGQAKAYSDYLVKASGKSAQTLAEVPASDTKTTPSLPDINDLLSKGNVFSKDIPVFQRIGMDAFYSGKPGEPSEADKIADQDKTGATRDSVNRLKSVFNSIRNIDDVRTQREQQQLAMKEKAQETLADHKLAKDAEEQGMIDNMVRPPAGWTGADAAIMDKSPVEVETQLKSAGVPIPSNLAGLLAVARGEADLKTYGQKTYKGTNKLAAGDALTYIRNFLNPQYNESDYGAMANLNSQLKDTRNGTAGGSLMNAGVASNHLAYLRQAADDLKNGNQQWVNGLANNLGIKWQGKTAPVVFKAVTDMLNMEVAKVTAGGTPHEAELAKLAENLHNAQAPQQIRDVLSGYIHLMNGRITEINDRSQQVLNREVRVSPETARIFGSEGLRVPGWGLPARDASGQIIGLTLDGKTFSMDFRKK